MLLELQHIARMYGSRCVFKDVSFSVPAGSLTVLVGANGAGKSTLMHIMAGLARPSAGEVLHHVQPAEMAYLGHATFIYPALTARENLRFWGAMYGVDVSDMALDTVLERVELQAHAHERAAVFSRGMAQRLNVARVLLLEPRLLLLDEPATGLDTASSHLLRREIVRARERGAGIVWITHDVLTDAPLADRLLALRDRRLAYDGEPTAYTDALEKAVADGGRP
ncbi:MAG: heme ABC exporter ATP-binding protein CcmA [Desulfovibrionaceae bacterium]